jgi:hypothetical protein
VGQRVHEGFWLIAFIAICAVWACGCLASDPDDAQPRGDIDPARLLVRIYSEGPSQVAASLSRDPATWQRVTTSIASGDGAWLAVAQMLRPYSTGTAKKELRIALEEALIVAPATTVSEFGSPETILRRHPGWPDPDLRDICSASARDAATAATQSLERRSLAVTSMLSLGKFPSLDKTLMANLGICEKFLEASAHLSGSGAVPTVSAVNRLDNPMAMARELAQGGVAPTLARLTKDQGLWPLVLSLIGSGKLEWVMDGIVLVQQPDSPSRRTVETALQNAFVNNGPAVLGALGQDDRALSSICGPSLEDASKSTADSLSSRARMAKQLEGMLDPSSPKTSYANHVEECGSLLRAATDLSK